MRTIDSSSKQYAFLSGGGEVGQQMRAHDWAASPLGPLEGWPQSLKTTVSICLNSPMLATVLWGPDLLMLYNDAYVPSLADRHPNALGKPVAEVWDSSWEHVSAPFHRCMRTGEGFSKGQAEALIRAEEALRQSQKLEAIGQLTGSVAHDFNNLLTVIKFSADMLKKPDLPNARRQRCIGAISDTVDRAAKLTSQLLSFARRQALKPEVFAACASVRSLSGMMETLTGSLITIITTLPQEQCFVEADISQFETALVNMALNGRDAMGGEGQLAITVQPVEQIPALREQPAIAGSFVEVSITDTGVGIANDRFSEIFEPFFTTKGTGHGTGLGLSQVFGFAKQSGGEVTVQSLIGSGSTFSLYLPRVEAPAPSAAVQDEQEALVDGHGTCVLVVEDNVQVGNLAVQSLMDLGYVPVLANNADEALAELAADADRFDVVFSDVVMPGMNGIELAHRIRKDHYDLPVLLASGYSEVLAQNGNYGFELLHKPYSIDQLSSLLRKVANWKRRQRILGSA